MTSALWNPHSRFVHLLLLSVFPSCRCCAGCFCKYALCRTSQFCSYLQFEFILPQEEKAQQPAWLQSAVCEKTTKRFHDLQERTEASCRGRNQHHWLCRCEQNPGPEGKQSFSHKLDQEIWPFWMADNLRYWAYHVCSGKWWPGKSRQNTMRRPKGKERYTHSYIRTGLLKTIMYVHKWHFYSAVRVAWTKSLIKCPVSCDNFFYVLLL